VGRLGLETPKLGQIVQVDGLQIQKPQQGFQIARLRI
jgi:hypothetical protein